MDTLLDILIYWEEEKQKKHENNVRFHKKLLYNVLKNDNEIKKNKNSINCIINSYNTLTDWKISPSKFKRMDKMNQFPIVIETKNNFMKILKEEKQPDFIEYFFNLFD